VTVPFLDTNILLRHLRQDDPVLAAKATAILTRVEQGELIVRTSDTVIFETVFTLQRFYKVPPDQIAQAVLPIIELPGIILPGKRAFRQVFELYRTTSLGFADCYHAVLTRRWKLTEILTFDQGFDRLPGITRREE
jgi:predicted nucleic acid-binding protein